jgi:hypothetical protein
MADDFDFESLRPFFDELHGVTQAACAAIGKGDMQEWLELAARGAELHELIAARTYGKTPETHLERNDYCG